ncbi:MAG: shikimate dehydrogenase, partial [Prochloraceae cyanobacterium]
MQIITGKTKLLGVIGDPIEHSFSPVMHNAAIAHLNLNYVYLPFKIEPEDLKTAIAGFRAIDLVGFNVTIPHKQNIIPLLDRLSEDARLVGAVNTVWRDGSSWCGTNTDVEGFLAPLKNIERDWRKIKAIVLGNGGAARAVVVGLYRLGCKDICVFGRDINKLRSFKDNWQDSEVKDAITIEEMAELDGYAPLGEICINCTPIGMYPHSHFSPVSSEIIAKFPVNAIFYDLIYNPRPTEFLKIA